MTPSSRATGQSDSCTDRFGEEDVGGYPCDPDQVCYGFGGRSKKALLVEVDCKVTAVRAELQ